MDLVAKREGDLSPEEAAVIAAFQEDGFGDQPWTAEYRWAPADWRLLLRDGGEPVSYLGITTRLGAVGGEPVRLGGIGSVATPTALRGRGYATELLRRSAGFMFDELGLDLGLLFCLPHLVPYYGSRGWIEVRSGVWIEQPRGRIRWPHGAMVRPKPGAAWHDAEIDVRGLPW